ncbi:BTAD domain-containing putative transcriptional regulator [Cryptosporangium sp. NPDC048952]|uniref:AfsR/SARP family transcriptional regulator n=1 Tax=Cryptosporangium sp. NPDC048952 TaxID=3363961 RepID=UPI0037156A0C
MLALLLARAGEQVPLDEMIDALWPDGPPASAAGSLHGYASRLRRALEPDRPIRAPSRWIERVSRGYRLVATADEVDLLWFRRRVAEAREAASTTAAIPAYVDALEVWHGPVAAGLDMAVRSHPTFRALDREYAGVLADAADVALDAGLTRDVLPFLQRQAALEPLDEALQARVIRTLAAEGRRGPALALYRSVRDRLVDELGIEPGPELRSAHEDVLHGEGAEKNTVPAQLPAALATFTGRAAELAAIDAAVDAGAAVAVRGMGGVGKTALVVRWAHSVAARYPDGQLYVDLRGFDENDSPVDPGEALRAFLDALGVPPASVPDTLDAQASLYRSLLAGRRVLVVIDDARDAKQVGPLLPGARGCTTVVTSRDPLAELVATGAATSVPLGAFTAEQSRGFLLGRLGITRVTAEPDAVDRIVARCGRLPLALAIVAARAALNSTFTLAALADELESEVGLDAFTVPGLSGDLRAVFSGSYRTLRPETAALFRRMAAHPGPDLGFRAAVAMAGQPEPVVRRALRELVAAHLVIENGPGRFTYHDLLRDYAVELSTDEDDAFVGALDYYLHTAIETRQVLAPARPLDRLMDRPPGLARHDFTDASAVVAWYETERGALLEMTRAAERRGFDAHVCQLAAALSMVQHMSGRWRDWMIQAELALLSAARQHDPWWMAHAHHRMAIGLSELSRSEEAVAHSREAARLFAAVGDTGWQAMAQVGVAAALSNAGRLDAALEEDILAIELHRAIGDRAGEAYSENNRGWRLSLNPDTFDEAATHYRRAAELFAGTADRYGEASVLANLAQLHRRREEWGAALDCNERALALFAEIHGGLEAAQAHHEHGICWWNLGSAENARASWKRALALVQDADQPAAEQLRDELRVLLDGPVQPAYRFPTRTPPYAARVPQASHEE